MQRAFHLSADAVAQRIGFSLDRWVLSCDGIVRGMLVKGLVGADAEPQQMRPGPWRDPSCPKKRLLYHVYLRLKTDGWIIDPTRWCYEGKRPEEAYIYFGDGHDDGVKYDGTPLPWTFLAA